MLGGVFMKRKSQKIFGFLCAILMVISFVSIFSSVSAKTDNQTSEIYYYQDGNLYITESETEIQGSFLSDFSDKSLHSNVDWVLTGKNGNINLTLTPVGKIKQCSKKTN